MDTLRSAINTLKRIISTLIRWFVWGCVFIVAAAIDSAAKTEPFFTTLVFIVLIVYIAKYYIKRRKSKKAVKPQIQTVAESQPHQFDTATESQPYLTDNIEKTVVDTKSNDGPQMDEKLGMLRQAAEAGEIIKVKYYGGSHPGEIREIVPRKIHEDKLSAYCYMDRIEKSFFIEKIAILDENGNVLYGGNMGNNQFQTIEDLYNAHKTEWEQASWNVVFEKNSIRLYRKYKNGKQLKYPDFCIEYIEDTYDYSDFSNGEEVKHYKKSVRPWHVNDRQYKLLDKAIARFLEIVPT